MTDTDLQSVCVDSDWWCRKLINKVNCYMMRLIRMIIILNKTYFLLRTGKQLRIGGSVGILKFSYQKKEMLVTYDKWCH